MTNNLNSNKVSILNIELDNLSSSQLLSEIGKGGVLFASNVDRLVRLQKDRDFLKVYQQADYVVCNSQFVLWVSKFLGSEIKEKIANYDFFPQFYQRYQHDEKIKIFLLGEISETVERAKEKINNRLTRPIVVGAYACDRNFLEDEVECQKIVSSIGESGATVVVTGIDTPVQEKWIDKYKEKLPNVKIFLALGNTIDFEAGIDRKPPKWMRNWGLEWFYRLITNPKKLWKRYLVDDLSFFSLIWQQKFNSVKFKQKSQLKSPSDKFHPFQATAKPTEKLPKVLMFGPSLSERGGMGAVQKQIVRGVEDKISIQHVTTWNGKTSTLALFSKALIVFFSKLFDDRIDIVHIHISERGSAVRKSILAAIAFAFNKPVIMHTHGCEFHLFYENLPAIGKRVLSKVLQQCAYVIALSKSWQKSYIEMCDLDPEKVVVLYNPVIVPKNVPDRLNAEKITFLLVGKINQRKGVFDILNAIATLPDSVKAKIELIIAGSGETDAAIALAKQLNIESLVTFPGWVNTEQRDRLLAKAHAFLLPSYNEGLPMALLEAMSWGLPVIVTPVGGIPEIITHRENGLSIEPGNIEQLAASIQNLIDDESLRLRLGKAAREQSLLLDLTNYSHNILNLYYAIAKKMNQPNAKIK